MDHKSFETNMIDFVNRNAQAEEEIRRKDLQKQQTTAAEQKRKKVTNAVIESIFWALVIPCIVVIMSFAEYLGFIPAEIAIIACSLFTFIGGVRLNTLTFRIKKYGGR